ncbi:MAG: 2-thiouracil desulfurase family protein [Candidatus Bathyarchaeota archaeon]|nr:2-thiouracil desulfurase family protein [Candidatus Bathyarchaeota archaeon]
MPPVVFKLALVSHCILNQAVRYWPPGARLERPVFPLEIVSKLYRMGFSLLQLPCPEFLFKGNPRPSYTRTEYEMIDGFQDHCRKLASELASSIEHVIDLSTEPRIELTAVVGVERSPSCAVFKVPVSSRDGRIYVDGRGIFMDMLEQELRARGLYPRFISVDFKANIILEAP